MLIDVFKATLDNYNNLLFIILLSYYRLIASSPYRAFGISTALFNSQQGWRTD